MAATLSTSPAATTGSIRARLPPVTSPSDPIVQMTNDLSAASLDRYWSISTMELMPEPNIMPRMRMTMMSLMRRLTAITTSSTSAAPSHAAPAMPSDCTNECAETPSSGAPSRNSATPSPAPELMPST